MIPSEDIFREIINQNTRRLYSRILCDDSEVIGSVRTWTLNKGSCGNGSFQPQSVFSNYADITIDDCSTALKGKKLAIQIGVKPNDNIIWLTIATLYASDQKEKGNRTTIPCLGVISAKLGKKFNGGTYTTVSSLLAKISEVAGCSITLDDGFNDLEIPAVDLSDYYYREILQFVAGIYFGFVSEMADGSICIKSYKSISGTIPAYLSRMAEEPDFYEEATVEGVQVINAEDVELITGSLQNCSLTNPLMTEEAFNTYNSNYIGYSYQAHSSELTLGDPTIEPWDCLTLQDRKGVVHTLPCMSIKHTFDGGLRTSVSAPTLDSGEDYSRPEVEKKATTSYNALVSGNFGSGNTGGGGDTSIAVFNITGTHVSSGIGWIDSGGGQAFMSLNMSIPSNSQDYNQYTGSLSFHTGRDLSPYVYTQKVLTEYMAIPIFAYNGTNHYSAGGLNITASIDIANSSYTISLGYTNDYLYKELGELFVYNADTQTYDGFVSANFQVNLSWLLNTVRE